MIRLISATGKFHSRKLAAIILASTICGVLAFAVIDPPKYAIAAAVIALLSSVFTTWLVDD